MSDLLKSLGVEFVDPYEINTGLKKLKPLDEPQIFSVITNVPGLPNPVIKYPQHYFDQLKKTIRCHGGSCCIKAAELKEAFSKLSDEEKGKRSDGRRQMRYILPVVLYSGKSAQAYGGPIEVRYLNISGYTYDEWDQARETVNADIAPFYERDFVLTKKSPQIPSACMHHLESRAKWLTDPAINAEVMKIISQPDFLENYVKVIPPKMTEEEFLDAWAAGTQKTAAEQAVASATTIQPAVAVQPTISVQPNLVNIAQPVVPEAQPVNINVMAQPQATVQPVVEPVASTEPVAEQVVQPVSDVQYQNAAYTPQNIINGSYTMPPIDGAITAAQAINAQPTVIPQSVTEMPVATVEPVTSTEPAATTDSANAVTQSEISLANIGDLDAIINSLPQV